MGLCKSFLLLPWRRMRSYFKTGNNTEAIANLDKALGLNSKNENARYYKGLIYISQKDKINAQRMVDELQRLSSRHAATLQTEVGKM
jgi:tetratricopeptide (TPR) repeat protein